MSLLVCKKCGAQLPEGAYRCPECGTPVDAPEVVFTPETQPVQAVGQGVSMCKECGAKLPEGVSICPECGSPVDTPEIVSAPETQPVQAVNPSVSMCKECGVQLPEGASVCPECGSLVDTALRVSPSDTRSIRVVEPVVKYCSKCGTQLAPEQAFCPKCGTKSDAGIVKKKGKKRVIIPIICVIFLALAAAAIVFFTQPKVESITASETSIELTLNETFQATYTVTPEKAAKVKTTWTSSNENIAKVDQTGLITAVSDGNVTITVTAKDKMSVISLKVIPPIESLTVNKNNVTLKEKETFQINCTITPEAASKTQITYTSDNESVAKVDSNGLVTGVSDGTATITLKAKDKTASVSVTVKTGPDFKAVYNKIGGEGYYCELGSDNSYLTIDTNPFDLDDYTARSALNMVSKANSALGLPDSVYRKMLETRSVDGRVTDTHNGVKVSWTYHPDHGLEVLYEAE